MPKASPIQTNFNSGELSSLLYGRVDSPRYKQGLATCLNYIPTLQGPLTRRPGTKYVTNAKDSTKPPVLVPFQFSETQAYMLEFGDKYIRFYANNAPVITTGTSSQVWGFRRNTTEPFYATQASTVSPSGYFVDFFTNPPVSVTPGSILELVTPYAYADLPLLRWTQNADTLYLVHPSYPPMKLQRLGLTFWQLSQIRIQDGPYLPPNSYKKLGDSVNYTLTATSVNSSQFTFRAGPSFSISGVANNGGKIQVTTSTAHIYNSGDTVVVDTTGMVGNAALGTALFQGWGQPAGGYFVVESVPSSTTLVLADTVWSGSFSYTSGGTLYPAIFTGSGRFSNGNDDSYRPMGFYQGGVRFWGSMSASTDASRTFVSYDLNLSAAPSAGAGTAFQVGVYYTGNYPAATCFHQDRLCFAGAPQAPQQIAASQTSNYENFAVTDKTTLQASASLGFGFDLLSSDLNAIHWLKSTSQGLLAGTYTNDWNVTPSSLSEALSSLNVNAVITTSYGSAQADAAVMGNGVLYIQRAKRKVRELNYFFQVGTFRSTDLTELSEHITLPTIIKLAVQKENLPLVWGLRSDGLLLSLSYDRDDVNLRTGWARHQLGGQSDASGTNAIVQSFGVIPSTDLSFDQLWMTVQRWINGASVITVEYMTKVFDQSTLQEDAYQFDCGATFDSPLTITAISTASPAVVTSAAHGLANGDQIRIVSVVGLNKKTTDADGNVTTTNLVNEQTFVVASAATNTFALNDFNGNAVSSTAYAAYVSGGQVRKMVKTISNLTWLENETVSILADGAIHPDVVVSNSGAITLNYRAAKVQIGYSYNSDGRLLRPEAGSADGSSIGKTRRVSRVAVMLSRVGDFLMGMSFSRLLPVRFQQADQAQADQATPLFSGIHRDGVESAYDFEGQFCFRQNTGLPGTVQAVTLMLDEMDV